MWRSTSPLGKWLTAIVVTLTIMLVPWRLSLTLLLMSSIWFRDWYPGLLPAVWFDVVYGSPIDLPFYPGVIPISALLVVFVLIVTEGKHYFRFQI